MRLFGLILFLILSGGIAFGTCPSLNDTADTMPSVVVLDFDVFCGVGDVLDLFNEAYLGSVTELVILGNVTLSSSSLRVVSEETTTIIVRETGSLFFLNGSFLVVGEGDVAATAVELFVEDQGVLHIMDSSLDAVSLLDIETPLVTLFNVTLQSPSDSSSVDLFFRRSPSSVISLFNASFGESTLHTFEGAYDFRDALVGGIQSDSSQVSMYDSSISSEVSGTNSSFFLYNTTYGSISSSFTNSSLHRFYPVSFFVYNEMGIPLRGITISGIDVFLTSRFSDITFTDGAVFSYLESYSFNQSDSFVFYSNYTISVVDTLSSVYEETSFSLNVTSPLTVPLVLNTSKGIIRVGADCSPDRPFCTIQNPISSCTDMRAGDSCAVQFVVNGTNNFPGVSLFGFHTFFMIAYSNTLPLPSTISPLVNMTFG